MKFYNNKALAGASAPTTYTIDRSLRFRSSASAYLSRTPASAGNLTTWTWSGWVKRGKISEIQVLFSAGVDANNFEYFRFESSDQLFYTRYASGSQTQGFTTNAVYRDVGAWYHIIITRNGTTQKCYVNGVEQTRTSETTSASNGLFNSTNAHSLGRRQESASQYLDGYLTEVNFIDGQALTPDSFGEYNATTGVWQPIKYTGTYGTNGFYLNFSDNSTTTTLGYDTSGNSNNWTANNISVTAGATYDSMTDVPTLTSTDAGNYCTLNPLSLVSPTTLANGNLDCVTGTTGGGGAYGTIAVPSSGKFYFEYVLTATSGTLSDNGRVGIASSSSVLVLYLSDGKKQIDGTQSAYGASWTTNDVIGVAVNIDSGSVTFYKNNTSQGSISYTIAGKTMFPYTEDGSGAISISSSWNFGQRPFAYTPPTGFKSLNTYNLPDSTIVDGSEYFNTVLYTGTGPTPLSVTGVGFEPSFVWLKRRNNAGDHWLFDQVRGVENLLETSTTDAEQNLSESLVSFDADGFSLGTNTSYNSPTHNVVAWNWKANGSGVSNTDGSITSTVSANTTAGFSIVSWTNQGSNTDTVGHGLGQAPKIYISKKASTTGDWFVFYSFVDGSHDYLLLNSTQAVVNHSIALPTSTVFTTGAGNTDRYITYCFAEVEGFSKMGSYTGNGSADGPFVYTGFRPAFVMVKNANVANSWRLWDNKRPSYNVTNLYLSPDTSGAEGAINIDVDFTSNGFKIRNTNSSINGSGNTIIYLAFAENPFKNSLAR